MYIIQRNNVITLTRGDYLRFPVDMTMGQFPAVEKWVMEEGDMIIFSLMEYNQPFEKGVFQKQYTYKDLDENENLFVTILPEDTINLCPGTYYYAIKAIYKVSDGSDEDTHIDTLIQKTKFIIVD